VPPSSPLSTRGAPNHRPVREAGACSAWALAGCAPVDRGGGKGRRSQEWGQGGGWCAAACAARGRARRPRERARRQKLFYQGVRREWADHSAVTRARVGRPLSAKEPHIRSLLPFPGASGQTAQSRGRASGRAAQARREKEGKRGRGCARVGEPLSGRAGASGRTTQRWRGGGEQEPGRASSGRAYGSLAAAAAAPGAFGRRRRFFFWSLHFGSGAAGGWGLAACLR